MVFHYQIWSGKQFSGYIASNFQSLHEHSIEAGKNYRPQFSFQR